MSKEFLNEIENFQILIFKNNKKIHYSNLCKETVSNNDNIKIYTAVSGG